MIPVTVRLANSNVDAHITQRLSGLSWRSVVPGGYASATFSLQKPIDVTDKMLAPFTRVYVYDGRSGDTLWEGRLQMSGRSAGDQGQVWALTAIGPSAHTLDQTAPLIYIDKQLGSWVRSSLEATMSQSATVSVANHPATTELDAVVVAYPSGVPVDNGFHASALYEGFTASPMEIGAVGFSWDAGFASTWTVEMVVGAYPTYTTIPFSTAVTTAGGTYTGWVVTDFPAGRDIASVRLVRASGGPATTGGDATWATFSNIRVIGRRITKAGVLLSGSAGLLSSVFVRASWVVDDLLGRMLPQYDGPNAALTAADTVDIDQLAYIDAVNPSQVLDDLMKLEPASYWAAWESNSAGKYRFEWSTWPSTPRYEASVDDGFDSPAPSFEVYNKVKVRWKDPRGRTKTTTRTQAVEMLDNEGIIREAFVDVSDEMGSSPMANVVGDNFLAEHKSPSSGGTLTIARPIRDVTYSRQVMPWQIVPGELIRVRGIEASQAITGDATRDGITVFRIVSVEVKDDGTATLELDMFTPTESRALAELAKQRPRKR